MINIQYVLNTMTDYLIQMPLNRKLNLDWEIESREEKQGIEMRKKMCLKK